MPGTVSVACKLPAGLLIQHEIMVENKGMDGAISRHFVKTGPLVALNGSNTARVIGGYGITENVDADWFAKWLECEKGSALVAPTNPLIFAWPTRDKTEGQAKDHASTTTGLEPLRQDRPAPGIEIADK